jgi:hypothetical protein
MHDQSPLYRSSDSQDYNRDSQDAPTESSYDAPSVPYTPYTPYGLQPLPITPAPKDDGVSPDPITTPHPANVRMSTEELPPDQLQQRKFWFGLGLALALLLLVLAATATYRYVNRPTPQKTLNTFCSALQNENYQEAYNQFTPTLQGQFSERDFSQVLARDKVVACTHGAVSDSSNMISTTLKLVHKSRGVNSDMVFLTKDNQDAWRINDLQRMS